MTNKNFSFENDLKVKNKQGRYSMATNNTHWSQKYIPVAMKKMFLNHDYKM